MRSMSIPVGRLFGVDVRIHLTFFLLPMFVFWTDYAANRANANGAHDMALVGIILACVCAHECGHMLVARRMGMVPKAVILLPLTGVTLYDESRTEKRLRARRRPLAMALPSGRQAAEEPGVGESLSGRSESHARLSSGWRTHPAHILLSHSRRFRRHPPRGFHQQRDRHGPDDRGPVQR
jgi:hypothetical protein